MSTEIIDRFDLLHFHDQSLCIEARSLVFGLIFIYFHDFSSFLFGYGIQLPLSIFVVDIYKSDEHIGLPFLYMNHNIPILNSSSIRHLSLSLSLSKLEKNKLIGIILNIILIYYVM